MQKQPPKVPELNTRLSGYSASESEKHLLLAYHYCCLSYDYATLSNPVLQALFRAALIEYFSVMKQKEHRPLKDALLAYLGTDSNPDKDGLELHLRHHVGPPSDLVETYLFFEAWRDKGVAHKDPKRAQVVTLEEQTLWVKVPPMPPVLSAHPVPGDSYCNINIQNADIPEKYRRAFANLISVTLQIIWQRPQMLPERFDGSPG